MSTPLNPDMAYLSPNRETSINPDKIFRLLKLKDFRGKGVTPFYNRFISLLEENYADERLNVNLLSLMFCLCPMQLYRKVRRQTGLPPGQLLLKYRISRSLDLLFNTEFNITEIAYKSGFGSPAHFSKAFKRVVGSTPKETRRWFFTDVINAQKNVINE